VRNRTESAGSAAEGCQADVGFSPFRGTEGIFCLLTPPLMDDPNPAYSYAPQRFASFVKCIVKGPTFFPSAAALRHSLSLFKRSGTISFWRFRLTFSPKITKNTNKTRPSNNTKTLTSKFCDDARRKITEAIQLEKPAMYKQE
jgi:hypothetical protein